MFNVTPTTRVILATFPAFTVEEDPSGIVLTVTVTLATFCDDVDSEACRRMSAARPDLCSDETIRKAACPKFCDNCPKVCYFCNGTSSDYHLCTSTITCQWEEVCMHSEMKSYSDGHREFKAACATKTFCDDPWQGMNIFGKRDLTSRDVSVSCCNSDLCNHPNTTTTTEQPITTPTTLTTLPTTTPGCTSCCKDLIILLDVSGSMSELYVKRFLVSVVTALPIRSSGLLVSVVAFSYQATTIFDIGEHVTKSETVAAIDSIQFQHNKGYLTVGVDYLLNHTLTSKGGDRPDFPNIVLIITDDGVTPIYTSKERELHSKASHVIAVQIGHGFYPHLASSQAYSFHIYNPSSLYTINTKVVNLVCT